MTTEKQSKKTIQEKPARKKAPSRGGARKNSGRPPGSSNKISGASILEAISNTCGISYEQQLAQNYIRCVQENDKAMVAKYDQMFLGKVVADKTQIDHTSNGETIQAAFAFIATELPDYEKK